MGNAQPINPTVLELLDNELQRLHERLTQDGNSYQSAASDSREWAREELSKMHDALLAALRNEGK